MGRGGSHTGANREWTLEEEEDGRPMLETVPGWSNGETVCGGGISEVDEARRPEGGVWGEE